MRVSGQLVADRGLLLLIFPLRELVEPTMVDVVGADDL
jgi:hypothetical protein